MRAKKPTAKRKEGKPPAVEARVRSAEFLRNAATQISEGAVMESVHQAALMLDHVEFSEETERSHWHAKKDVMEIKDRLQELKDDLIFCSMTLALPPEKP
jgi:hypothetical protein